MATVKQLRSLKKTRAARMPKLAARRAGNGVVRRKRERPRKATMAGVTQEVVSVTNLGEMLELMVRSTVQDELRRYLDAVMTRVSL